MVGRTLSHYRIVERLGAGGMGEVYRAHDERLDRDVALKVLPEGALADEKARARFHKEAHALSRLSHPHVAHLLDFDSEGGIDFLVMELVAGPSLSERLRDGPLPEKDVLRLGAQLARGLQAAHEQGVIHRDLKPSNLHLTPDGLLKILDFGLARLLQPKTAPPGHSTATETAAGAVVGSPPYMAPEQLLGKPPDPRTDLYAAGVVLYEMATGQRPFGSRSGVALTDAILHEEPPPPRSATPELSPALEAVILKALDKDPELRHQTAKDLLVDLERLHLQSRLRSSGGEPIVSSVRPAWLLRSRWGGVATLVAAALLLAGLGWTLRPPPLPQIGNIRPMKLTVGSDFQSSIWATWATDGVRVYYVAREEGEHRLHHVALSGGEPAEIPTPFGEGLEVYGYLRRHSSLIVLGGPSGEFGRVRVWLLPLPKGAPRPVGDLAANFVAVSPDEDRLAMSLWEQDGSRVVVVRLDKPAAPPLIDVPVPASGRAFALRWSPNGERLRFTANAPVPGDPGTWVWQISMVEEHPRPLWPGRGGAWTADTRHFVFERQAGASEPSDLFVAPDRSRWPWTRRDPGPLTNGPISFREVGARGDGSGLLAFGELPRGELQRFDRKEARFERLFGGESLGMVSPSPDRHGIAWVAYPDGTLWRSRANGTERQQLTEAPLSVTRPVWSPDGTKIAFLGVSWKWSIGSIGLVPAEGGPVEILADPEPDFTYVDPCWLPDGSKLVFSRGRRWRPGLLSLDVATRAITAVQGAEDLLYPRCGPQGQLLAFRPGVGSRPPSRVVRWPESGGWEEVGLASFGDLAWTRDGRSVCGHDLPGNRIACLSFDTGQLETLAEIGDEPLLNWPVVPWMGLDADDNPLVMRDRSTRDIYALDWEAP